MTDICYSCEKIRQPEEVFIEDENFECYCLKCFQDNFPFEVLQGGV